MRRQHITLALSVAAAALPLPVLAQTEFTYQGRLDDAGAPASGDYDFIFRIYAAQAGGSPLVPPVQVDDWPVSGGLFTVQLDFGANVFDGDSRWLQVEVRPGSEITPHIILAPRQPLTAVPYAMFAFGGPGGGGGFWAANGLHIHKTNVGSVGINTDSPARALEVRNSIRAAHITGQPPIAGSGLIELKSNNIGTDRPYGKLNFLDANDIVKGSVEYGFDDELFSPLGMRFKTGGQMRMFVSEGGNIGINTTDPGFRLDVNGRLRFRQGSDTTAGFYLHQTTPGADRAFIGMRDDNRVGFYGGGGSGWAFLMDVNTGDVGIGTASPGAKLDVNGTARVKVLEITGADVAERFPTSETGEIEPGTIMAIDPANPGKLCVAAGAYNRCIAGVVTGAGDVPVGAILGNLPGQAADAPAIALTGRVWVRCDAAERAIRPGDLLTTSDTPGCAMAVSDPARALGAVVGKAMTALEQGESGLVLVLVSLQ